MTWTIPLTDVVLTEDDVQAVMTCLESGWLTMGPRVRAFEEAFAEYAGTPHAVAVSSGTSALHLSLLAAGVGPGDEVIVPSLTFVAGAAAVRYVGATPVLCDIVSAAHPLIDVDDVARRLTPRTRAVVAVHFFGYAAAIEQLRALCDEHGLALIEDAAQAIGARSESGALTGTIGDLGCFSFFSKKQLSLGEGGMVTTADEALAARIRSLRSHAMTSGTWDRHRGHAESYDVVDFGYNFRLDEPRAALGLSRLPRLEGDLERRRRHVRAYRSELAGVAGLAMPFDDEAVERSSHFAFVILLPDRARRDALRSALAVHGVQTTWYPALSALTAYLDESATPIAAEVSGRHCALPLSAGMSDEQRTQVVAAVRAALA
ncbi:MAG TPA: DegT/DnrJ/EryC1/StrS family aminotransferase [Gaiellales bacterium]